MIGTLAWHGMGLGKTLGALWAAQKHTDDLIASGLANNPKVAIFCPKSAVITWRQEINTNVKALIPKALIYPISSIHHFVKSCKYHDVRYIIIDESHAFKSPETDRISVLAKLFKTIGTHGNAFKNGRMMLLTGTPMPNGAHELYTSFAMCTAPDLVEASKRLQDPKRIKAWEYSYADRKKKNFRKYDRKTHSKVNEERSSPSGAANVDLLGKLLTRFTHYRRVTDCIDIPKAHEHHINLGLPDDDLLRDADIEKPEAYMAIVERLSAAKTPHMLSWINEFIRINPTTQLLVFTMHRRPLDALMAHFKGRARQITGKEKRTERDDNINHFKEGRYQILGMTYKCGSESLNLQNSYNSLYHGYPWTDSTLRQAMARTYRSGQLNETNHFFLTSGQNDSRVLNLVRSKQEATNAVEDMLIELEKQRINQAIQVQTQRQNLYSSLI